MNPKYVLLVVLFALGIGTGAFAAEPVITETDVEWSPACGGSNIKVTRVDDKIVAVVAWIEGYSEGREWHCHYVAGRVSSVLYKHFKVIHKGIEGDGPVTREFQYDRVIVFPIKDHKLDNIPKELRDDLMEVLAKAQKSKPQE